MLARLEFLLLLPLTIWGMFSAFGVPDFLVRTAADPATVTCTVVDGDTLRCGEERVRLLGIDAPEMGGQCRAGRQCVAGDPDASKAALSSLVDGRQVRLERFGKDRYGRTLAIAWVGRTNLSCAQISGGHAAYIAQWDEGGRIGRC